MTFATMLAADGIVLLDGAMGTELERRGVPMSEQSWSGAALVEHPDAIARVHEDYIRAGAQVIITNTFAVSPFMLEALGLGDRIDATIAGAVELARHAREATGAEVAIAGSIANGAIRNRQRDPQDRLPPHGEMVANTRRMIDALAEGGCDLIALEMMQDCVRAPTALRAAKETGLPVWLGLTCARDAGDGHLTAFDFPEIAFDDIIAALVPLGPDVVSVMHTDVDVTTEALGVVKQSWSGPLGAYPEAGYFEMPHWNFVDVIEPAVLVDRAKGWVGQGVTILGGCCGLGTDHIAALHAARDDLGDLAC